MVLEVTCCCRVKNAVFPIEFFSSGQRLKLLESQSFVDQIALKQYPVSCRDQVRTSCGHGKKNSLQNSNASFFFLFKGDNDDDNHSYGV